jgi:FdhD protein
MSIAPSLSLPHLTQAQASLTRHIDVINEHGVREQVSIPAERALTVYVDKREIVTLMTLGAHPELLVLGYLRNQRLVGDVGEVESITVDWDAGEDGAGVAAVKTHQGIADLVVRTEKRVVTTGCGQGSVFGDLMGEIDGIVLPDARISQARLYGVLNAIRVQETTYKSAGSVHGCALFSGEHMQIFVEDVGRHNAIDTIAGWMWMHGVRADANSIFYTTGRLTSEMVMKSAQMGVAVVVSRSGMTQMGYDVATRLGLCTIGRAMNKHFLCYTASHRLQLQPELAVGGVHKVHNA